MSYEVQSSPATELGGETTQRFYMTYARSRPNELVPWIEEHDVPLLTNAVHRWSEARDTFLSMWEYDTPHVIDAGGYNVQSRFVTKSGNLRKGVTAFDVVDELQSEYPFYHWTVDEYHQWLKQHSHEFEWATVMDYACEDRFNELWSVEDRVQATLDNTLEQFNKNPSYKLLPVLQGRSVEEYVESYDWLNDHGIPTDHVGLGTICRLSSEKRIVELEKEIREKTDITEIHGFGAKVNAYKHGATFDSADSQAWVYGASNGRVYELDEDDDGYRLDERQSDDSLLRTVRSFKSYYAYVKWLKSGCMDFAMDEIIQEETAA